jgi:hypothetical protein
MITQKYSVNQQPVSVLLAWVQSGEIAIPEIQRPFVWDATKVRDLMDSLYQGFPVGYVISWQNPSVRLKDGSLARGKKILIDGQQRVTALRAAILGEFVVNKDYDKVRIRIAFQPVLGKFEVQTPVIAKDKAWIPDISEAIASKSQMKVAREYLKNNSDISEELIETAITQLWDILQKPIGMIDLSGDLDIETVTEIFIRINSQGVVLSQADFAMSKIAANETYGGYELRKAIDYFCNLAVNPGFHAHIRDKDIAFCQTDYYQAMSWLKDEQEDIYDPSYIDLLRVSFTTEFGRGKMADLVSLLSGRNFETRVFEESIAAESFARLKGSVLRFMNATDYKRYLMILRSAGFIVSGMIRSQNILNFGYIVYLCMRGHGASPAEIERVVIRWVVMSLLTGRYSGSPESMFDYDIKEIMARPAGEVLEGIERSALSDGFWNFGMVDELRSPSATTPSYQVFLAALVKGNIRGFLSRDITVASLIQFRGDIHHLYPRNYLKKNNKGRSEYNQVANYVYMQQEINIKIADRSPDVYFQELLQQCKGGPMRYGNINNEEELMQNLADHGIPQMIFEASLDNYSTFLHERRKLMAGIIERYYKGL